MGIAISLLIIYFKEFLAILKFIWNILAPVGLGLLFAMLLKTPLMFFNEVVFVKLKKKHFQLARGLSLGLSYLLTAALALLFLYVLFPQLALSLSRLLERLPDFINTCVSALENFFKSINVEVDWLSTLDKSLMEAIDTLLKSVINMTPDLIEFGRKTAVILSNLFFAFAFSGYILYDKEGMKRRFKRACFAFIPENFARKIVKLTERLIIQFDNFFSGQIIEALILGFLCFVGMLLLDIPYAPLVSTIVAITAIVPLLGAIIGTIPSAIIIMIDSPMKSLIFIIFIIVLQTLEGNLIYPHVVGNKVELPAFFVLFALIVGGGLFGIVGILICVPLASVLYKYIREVIDRRLKKKTEEKLQIKKNLDSGQR